MLQCQKHAGAETFFPAQAPSLYETNRRFYDSLWSGSRLIDPERFNTWPVVQSLLTELGPAARGGAGTEAAIADRAARSSWTSAGRLSSSCASRGGQSRRLRSPPCRSPSSMFELVCALDIIEHVEDEDGALSEISRVTSPGGTAVVVHSSASLALDAVR